MSKPIPSPRLLTPADEQALARDLELCAIGMVTTRGKLRKRYVAHYKACLAALAADNQVRGLGLHDDGSPMTDDEIVAELMG